MIKERYSLEPDSSSSFQSPHGAEQTRQSPEAIERNAERGFRKAFCGFEVVGVTVDSQQKRRDDELLTTRDDGLQDRMMTSLVSALVPGQKVTFVYEGGGRSRLRWYIVGEASGSESDNQARQGLRNVRNALNTVLESRRRHFRYQALARDAARQAIGMRGTWLGRVVPQGTGIEVGTVAMGFGESVPQSSVSGARISVFLPHYIHERSRAFASVAKLLPSCQSITRIQISLEPCRLNRDQEAAVRSALDVVCNKRTDITIPPHIEKAADIWLKSPSGCLLSCTVSSTAPISESFLRMLGGELYYGAVDVTVTRVRRGEAIATSHDPRCDGKTVDLRNAIPMPIPLPPLFAEPSTLTQHGMAKCFNRSHVALPSDGPTLGSVDEGQDKREVRLCESQRNRHLYVLGATGTGKSTSLFNLAMQDIQTGSGVCLIDPHGDLYDQVLRAIPLKRAKDVVLLDPSQRDRAVGLNLLECVGSHRDMQISFVINEILAIINKLYDMKLCGGPMFEQYFRAALQLVMIDTAAPGTLVDVSAVFEHRAYRESLIKMAGPSLVVDFWHMAERTGGEASLANIAPYIISKLNAIVHNAMLRPIIGQATSTIDFREIMDNRRILLVNLSRGALGELGMRLLGTIILTKMICASMSRLDMDPLRRTPFHVIVDEFQHFTTDATASLLSESRKFGICLTLAHQNLSQLYTHESRDSLIHSVLGNVGSIALFRLGAPDAEKLTVYTKPEFGPEDLQTLPNFHAAARFLTRSGPTPPFVFRTNPASRRRVNQIAQRLIAERRLQYTRAITDVEKAILERREAIRAIQSAEEKKADDRSDKGLVTAERRYRQADECQASKSNSDKKNGANTSNNSN